MKIVKIHKERTSLSLWKGLEIVSGVLCLILFSHIGAEAASPEELARRLGDKDATVQKEAAEELKTLGPKAAPAIPAMIETLKTDNDIVRNKVVAALGQTGPAAIGPLVNSLKGMNDLGRIAAAAALGKIGPASVPPLIELIKKDSTPAVVNPACWAIAAIGPDAKEALPALIELLKKPEWNTYPHVVTAVGKLGEVAEPAVAIISSKWNRGFFPSECIAAFGDIGPKAAPAVPKLAEKLMENYIWRDELRPQLFAALAKIGPGATAAIPNLMKHLRSLDPAWACMPAASLRGIGKGALPALDEAANDPDRGLRFNVAMTLDGMKDPGCVPILLKLTKDPEIVIQERAAKALENSAPEAAEAIGGAFPSQGTTIRVVLAKVLGRLGAKGVTPLLQGLKDADAAVRAATVAGFGCIGVSAVPALIEACGKGEAVARIAAFQAIEKIGAKASAAGPAAVAALSDNDKGVQEAAACALAAIGQPHVKSAIGHLQTLLKSDQPERRAIAATGLGTAGRDAASAVPQLVLLLSDPEWKVRCAACEALGRIDQPAGTSAPEIVRALRENRVWFSAVVALEQIGPAAAAQSPELVKIAQDTKLDWNSRWNACLALGRIKPVAPMTIQALTGLLGDPANMMPDALCRAFGTIGEPAVPDLIKALDTPALSEIATRALGTLGPSARTAVPKLMEALKKPPKDCTTASWALGEIGPDAKDALPSLMGVIKATCNSGYDPDMFAASTAAASIGKIGKAAIPLLEELKALRKSTTIPRTGEAIEQAVRTIPSAQE